MQLAPPRGLRLLLSGFAAGLVCGGALSALASGEVETVYQKLEVLAQVISSIENQYVDAVSPTELVYGAAKGAVGALDEHSAFFTPSEYEELLDATEGEYAGVGVELDFAGEYPEVVAVLPDSAAARAGLRQGDLVLAVDGESVASQSLTAVQQRLRGPVGSKLTLSVQRRERDEPWTFTLVRGWVRVAPIAHETLAGGALYVHVKSFSRRVAGDLGAILAASPPTRGLVLDLRGDPGGLFDEAVSMADLFLAEGPIVTAVGRGGRIIERHEAHAHGAGELAYRIAVLIDGGTASAAEVVAGALADRGRARLFGSRSYGKGSVQSVLDLSDGSGLKLTVARYYTPSGRQIDKHGIDPDEVIESREGSPDDEVLAAASRWLARAAIERRAEAAPTRAR